MWWSKKRCKDSAVTAGYRSGYCVKIFFWLLIFFAAGAGGALGYVIEGSRILRLVALQIGKADTLIVNQRVTTYLFDDHTEVQQAKEVVRYDFPDIFRTDLTKEGLHRFFLTVRNQSLSVTNDRVDAQAEIELDLYHYFLLHHRSNTLARFLEIYGVDTTISSLGKFDKRVAFVIGAQYPDEDHSQLWIDKENQLPMRWLLVSLSHAQEVDGEPGLERLEFRFSLWRKFDTLYYPMRVDILHNGVLRRENRVDSVEVNAELDKALMDIARQRKLYPQTKKDIVWDAPSEESGSDDIQKTIEDFKKKFE